MYPSNHNRIAEDKKRMQCNVCLQDKELDSMEAFVCAHVCCARCFARCDKCPVCRRPKYDVHDPRDLTIPRHARSLSEPTRASLPMVSIQTLPIEQLSSLALLIIERDLRGRR